VGAKLLKLLSAGTGVLGINLAILYSVADYSTTAKRILSLFAAGCCARRQLLNGRRSIPPQAVFMIIRGPDYGGFPGAGA